MVNVKNLFGMAVMATALVGCSSNDNLAPDGKDNVGKTGEAYASFKINLPTTNGTRAVDPKTGTEFNGGTADEYEVKNGTILIFDASTDKFVTKADLGTMNPWTDVKTNGVTTSAIATVKLTGVSTTGSYKALVLLNNNSETTPKVTLPTTADTYTSWSKDVDKANADRYVSTDGIFMANAPKYESDTEDPTTLVKINHVCASPEEAQAKAATVVYVERGLAKVTMEDFTTRVYSIDAGTYEGGNVEIKAWQLDVTNKFTFPVHQIYDLSSTTKGFADIWKTARFYDGTNTAFKRVYWGVDPNYNNSDYQTLENCKTAFNMITKDKVVGEAGKDHPQYCLENTFDLDNMKQGQTTRVVFKAKFTPKDFTANETFYKIGNNTAIWNATTLSQQIRTVAFAVMGITTTEEQNKYSVDINAGGENSIAKKAGQHLIKAENITYTGEGKSKVTEDVVNAINEKLGLSEAAGIATYLNGEAYYIARIKHFNELTPWTAGTPYGTDNESYLGRYGVLRNNWYDLSVTSISGLGYPDVPEVKPTLPDDENDQYVNVEVKILSWAKRSQQIKL
ncbi:Mfa1 family fimbria major subunit [Prevotella sp.]|uniref:Mfa1 family fimbria major subunit n=1 Tax=Prevotella sp. TaxID=59823 RepID=UPI0025DC27A3|nr:Mfa1 family fimbria major subunit [Prevotella sp.]MCI7371472.1 Mfa1 family fimbria major subunit [Prevotella sp.]